MKGAVARTSHAAAARRLSPGMLFEYVSKYSVTPRVCLERTRHWGQRLPGLPKLSLCGTIAKMLSVNVCEIDCFSSAENFADGVLFCGSESSCIIQYSNNVMV